MSTSVLSSIYTTTAPMFRGVWLHAPEAIEATERHFLFGNVGRNENVEIDETLVRLVGRPKPIAEYGENENRTLDLMTMIPYDDEHDEAVEWWRTQVGARRVLLYRDNRARLHYVSASKATIGDIPQGTLVACIATEVDYSEAI